jgi:hypothetical protein
MMYCNRQVYRDFLIILYKYSTLNMISTAYNNSYIYQDTMVSGTNILASEVTRLYPY